ncbi:TetR/AcrR family transcriptional regulator C-terminal domain-containing protein [Streptomyces sp. YU58]|uniref:TetR/AcrR family transcriptional regulator C-terminal domain-containing protein n=1 Tax=Streptomyces sp. SX92 TaxID=3158972 RepID=UPI0027B883EB|nr:TetR/AcrR family transcriptional regulator C-terminal domain-containing protein [Streptomyces coralus]WLW55773.1 TetR/AcrR family transcriptional regulator C-terminal domain-containing protein [Streptomyces coralus]
MAASLPPPYLRIAAGIRDRILSGELAAGQRVPSTRQIVREHGVAMATAAKALGALRDQGWVRSVPGGGTIVLERPPAEDRLSAENRLPGAGAANTAGTARPQTRSTVEPGSTREVVIRAAIRLADREGLNALTMRRLAADLEVGPMSLYRYIPDKEELLRLMADVAFGEEAPPEPGPPGWRAKLELSARLQWRAYRRHPWLPTIMHNSLVRPPAVFSGIRMVDWELRALDGLGLTRHDMLHTVFALDGYVGGIAASNALEVQAEHDTGVTGQERIAAERALHADIFGSGRFHVLADCIPSDATSITGLDELFEFGLRHQLDGIAAMLARVSGAGTSGELGVEIHEHTPYAP